MKYRPVSVKYDTDRTLTELGSLRIKDFDVNFLCATVLTTRIVALETLH